MSQKHVEFIRIDLGPSPEVVATVRYVGREGDLTIRCRAENAYEHVQQLAALADLFGHLAIRFNQEIVAVSNPLLLPPAAGNYGRIASQ